MKNDEKKETQLFDELERAQGRLKEVDPSRPESEQLERYRSFEIALETMQLGVTITDLEGNILYMNPADLEMHGFTQEEIAAKNVRILAPATKRSPMNPEKVAAMKRWKRESNNKRKDGSIFPVQLMSDVIRDADGNPRGIVTTCEDITKRKAMEAELRERIEELEKFYEASIQREVKMKKLKEEIRELKSQLSKNKASQ